MEVGQSWVFQYYDESNRQSLPWKTPGLPRLTKARMSKSRVKTMLIIFDHRGIVNHEFVSSLPVTSSFSQNFKNAV